MRTEPTSSGSGAPTRGGESPAKRHAVVIGSGFGGLATAIRLTAKGYRVTIVEKLDKPGGRAYVFEQDGFKFDAGPTIVTAPFLLDELWAVCGKKFSDYCDLVEMNPFYAVRFDDGSVFECSADQAKTEAQIERFNPSDIDGYRRFLAYTKEVYEFGFEGLGCRHFKSIWEMAAVAPKMMWLQGHRSVYSVVSDYIKDPKLRIVFSLHPLLIGANPCSVTAMYTLINHLEKEYGVHFAMGGTGALVQAMVKLFHEQGGTIRYNAEVAEVLIENNRAEGVRLADGTTIKADLVVSNGDCAWTYKNLVPKGKRSRWSDGKLKRARYSNGLFVWYFGTDRRYEDVPHHMMVLGPRYRGLLKDIFWRKRLADDFSLYLHRPTKTDPSLAPEGCDTFYALAPVPHLDADVDWAEMGPIYRDRVMARLAETVLPDLQDHVVSQTMMTPLDFQDRLLSYKGAGFGMEPVLWQSAWFRPNNISEEIERFYLVGASTHPGAGIPGVITSAHVLDQVVPHADALV